MVKGQTDICRKQTTGSNTVLVLSCPATGRQIQFTYPKVWVVYVRRVTTIKSSGIFVPS